MTDQSESQVTPFASAEEAPQVVAPAVEQQPVAQPFQVPEALQGLVGEGKKYASPEQALSSIPHAQNHIEKLEDEMASMREQLAKNRAAEEVLAEIKSATAPQAEVQATPQELDPATIQRVVQQQLEANKAQEAQVQNANEVVNKMTQHFGDTASAEQAYIAKATDLGLSPEALTSLAQTSPKAVLEMFGLNSTKSAEVPLKINSSVNTEALINQQPPAVAIKSVMGQSTHKDDIAAWKAAGAQT